MLRAVFGITSLIALVMLLGALTHHIGRHHHQVASASRAAAGVIADATCTGSACTLLAAPHANDTIGSE